MSPTTHIILGIIVAILGGAIAVLGGVWTNYGFNLKQKEETPSTGKISGKTLDGGKTYILNLGNNPTTILGSQLNKGINLGDVLTQLFGKINAPIKIYEENNRILIDTTIYNEKNQTICQIVGNEWQFNPNSKYDRNYSINAFEIINEKGIPVLQLYLSDNEIFIGGYFYADNGSKLILTTEHLTYITPDQQSFNENEMPKRLFEYPSSDHLGQLIRENLPRTNLIDRNKERAIEEETIAYSKLSNIQLKKKATEVIEQVKEFLAPSLEAYQQLEARRFSQLPNNPEDRNQVEIALEQEKAEIDARILPEYYARFQDQIVLLRREMLSRIPEDKRMNPDFYGHSRPSNMWMLTRWIGVLIKITEALPSQETKQPIKTQSDNNNKNSEKALTLYSHAKKSKRKKPAGKSKRLH